MKDVRDVICIQKVSYTSKKSGKLIEGFQFWFIDHENTNQHSIGTLPRSYWIPLGFRPENGWTLGKYEFDVELFGRNWSVTSVKKI